MQKICIECNAELISTSMEMESINADHVRLPIHVDGQSSTVNACAMGSRVMSGRATSHGVRANVYKYLACLFFNSLPPVKKNY